SAGVSVYTPDQSKKAIESGMWDVIQIAVNLMDQRQLPAIELAKANGIGVIVRSALFKGILTDRGANLHPKLKSIQAHRDVYNELLDDNTRSLSDLATKFVMSLDGVSSVLVGIDKNEYLDKAMSICNSTQLSDEAVARAKQLAYPEPEILNLPVWDRNGWL
ncbi:MAG: aldo/keto reductase, partial [Planctomycetes bacterium]|nr:aldo/keto reductase [Planctomycetota bacterium]